MNLERVNFYKGQISYVFFGKLINLVKMVIGPRESQAQKIILPGTIESRELKLQTRAGSDICNCQTSLITASEHHEFEHYEREFKDVTRRTDATAIYNCHGLAFASRRTAIDDPRQVWKIVKEDQYEEITDHDDVLPGVYVFKRIWTLCILT